MPVVCKEAVKKQENEIRTLVHRVEMRYTRKYRTLRQTAFVQENAENSLGSAEWQLGIEEDTDR